MPVMPVRGKSSGARKRMNESASGASVVTHDDGVVSNGTNHGVTSGTRQSERVVLRWIRSASWPMRKE